MNKFISVLVGSVFCSVLAQAAPHVGDSSTLMGTATMENGQSIPVTLTQTVQSMDDTNLTVVSVSNANGEEYRETSTLPISGYPTEESMESLVANCAFAGGEQRVITVQEMNILTCRLPLNSVQNGYVSMANVPFFVTGFENMNANDQMRMPAGTKVTMSLVAFTRGM